MLLELSEPCTQGVFAGLIGTAQPAVAALVAAGVLPAGGSAAEWIVAYARHLRDLAYGRGGAVADARLRLVKARADRQELDNRNREGELVEVAAVRRELSLRIAVLVTQLEAVPDRVAAMVGVDDAHRHKVRRAVAEEIDQARHAIADVRAADGTRDGDARNASAAVDGAAQGRAA